MPSAYEHTLSVIVSRGRHPNRLDLRDTRANPGVFNRRARTSPGGARVHQHSNQFLDGHASPIGSLTALVAAVVSSADAEIGLRQLGPKSGSKSQWALGFNRDDGPRCRRRSSRAQRPAEPTHTAPAVEVLRLELETSRCSGTPPRRLSGGQSSRKGAWGSTNQPGQSGSYGYRFNA